MTIKCNKCKNIIKINRKCEEGDILICHICKYCIPYQYSRDSRNI